MANWNLLPKSHREKDNLIINLFKPFKDTISKTNTCFRQHHDNVVSKKTFQRKDSVTVIKTQNHTTRQNSWSYVTIRELQARKHNQFSAMKRLWRKTKFRKDKHFMISKSRYLSFLETKICFQNSQPLKNNTKVMKFQKNCQERGDRSLISHPSLLKIRVKTLSSFSTDFTSDILKPTSRFKTRTLKLAFSKFQQWLNTKVKKNLQV